MKIIQLILAITSTYQTELGTTTSSSPSFTRTRYPLLGASRSPCARVNLTRPQALSWPYLATKVS